jgi:hypothetical protein
MAYQAKMRVICIDCGERPAIARRICRRCRARRERAGTLEETRKLCAEDVFEERITKTSTCWLWTGSKNSYGYGIILMPGSRPVRAHRYAYEKWVGHIPEGLVVMHICDTPACVKPSHLRVGDRSDNNRDAVAKHRNAFGERNGQHRLTKAQIDAIRADPRAGIVIGAEYGVHQSHVSRIKTGVRRSKG